MIRRPPRSTRTDTRVPYTPLFRSGLIANMALYKNLPYDLIKDFQPVSRIARIPNVLVVGANNKAGSLQAFIELARAANPPLTYASAGSGTGQHLAGALFSNTTANIGTPSCRGMVW